MAGGGGGAEGGEGRREWEDGRVPSSPDSRNRLQCDDIFASTEGNESPGRGGGA